MLAVVFLAVLASVSANPHAEHDYPSYPSYGHDSGPTFEEVKDLLAALENEKVALFEDLSHIRTVCSTAEENIALLENNMMTHINLKNNQQDELIELFEGQVKSMQHRRDAAKEEAKKANSIAGDTADALDEQQNKIDEIGLNNGNIDDLTDDLANNINSTEDAFMMQLNNTIDGLEDSADDLEDSLNDLADYLYGRKCEYGSGSFPAGDHDVAFKVNFTSIPVVSLQVIGFRAHLDDKKYGDYAKTDILGMDKYVDYVNTESFGVRVEDNTQGSVTLTSVFCTWSACQNLQEDV